MILLRRVEHNDVTRDLGAVVDSKADGDDDTFSGYDPTSPK